MDISEKIKSLRIKSGFSQNEIAEKLNITKPTYAGYEKGKDITLNTLNKLAKVYNIPLEAFFIDNIEIFKTLDEKGTMKRIPIISKVSAGKGIYGIEDILEWLEIPVSLCKGVDYATFVKGDSMEPKILDGDIVLIKQTQLLENGDIGIFKLNDDVFCKKYQSNPITKDITLKSINKIYEPIEINKTDEFYILGKVVSKIDYKF